MNTYTFATTAYVAHEDEVLRLRNGSRSVPQTRSYMEWRYRTTPGTPAPLIFWIREASGQPVGMCSLIFHSYCIDGQKSNLAVLGDISLNEGYRKRGLGQQLLNFMNRCIDERLPECLAFVIPNDIAETSLTRVGWTIGGKLYPYVFLTNPAARLPSLFGQGTTHAFLTSLFRRFVRALLALYIDRSHSLRVLDAPDASIERLWLDVPKRGLIVRDLGIESLVWRYVDHPKDKFHFAKAMRTDDLLGYLVYRISADDRTCLIYDLVVRQPKDLRPILALFLAHCIDLQGIDTVRVLLNDDHPYRRKLPLLGFCRRACAGVFQTYSRKSPDAPGDAHWLVTLGDKDI